MKKGRRYDAFSINLGDDSGETRLLCPGDKCLEVYSTKGVYQIFTPESLDPEETNPDMPGMAKKVLDVGTTNWIVARVMIQNFKIGESQTFITPEEKKAYAQKLRDIMGALLACSKAYNYILERVIEIERQVTIDGIQAKGNIYTDFPSTENLKEKITIYLTNAKHAIQKTIDIFNLFYNSGITGPKIDKLIKWSEKNDIATYVIDTLKHFEPIAKYIVDLRNRQEHPKENYTLEFSDFTILPTAEISAPLWGINEAKHSIHKEMDILIKELVVFVEWLVIHLVLSKEKSNPLFELCVFQIPDKQMDLDCPIKYRVETCFKQDSKH